jgi:hypothetical protein
MNSKTPAQAEPLSYSIDRSCEIDGICRSMKYRALNPDPEHRRGLPFLRTFMVGRKRLLMADDHRAWLEELRVASGEARDVA